MKPLQILGIDVHEYLVKDIDRARRFYGEVLGLQQVLDSPDEFELPDGSVVALYQPREGDDVSGQWQKGRGIFFAVDDAAEAGRLLRENGCASSDPLETPNCFMVFSEDSEGNQIILHQRKR